MNIRPKREEELSELVVLWNETHRGFYEFIPCTEEKLWEELADAELVLVAVQGDVLLGIGLLRREWYGEEVELCVPPGPEREEVEGWLLSALETHAKTDEVCVVLDADDTRSLAFFCERGYRATGSLFQMVVDLSSLPSPPRPPSGYVLRSLMHDEEAEFVRLVNTAYQGERVQAGVLARWDSEDPAFGPDWVQVAEYDGELVAAVVARSDHDFNQYYHAKRGYLGPAATLLAHRGRGLAKALTVKALEHLRKQGMESAHLYTWSGNAAALKALRDLDFRVAHEWRILAKSARERRGFSAD